MRRSHSSNASKRRSNPIRNRIFVAGVHAVGESVELEGSDARKMVTVLRKRTGDRIEVIDSATQRFSAVLKVDGRSVRATLAEHVARTAPTASIVITVAQAMPKGQKMDFVVEKLTELGVIEIVPFFSERTIASRVEHPKVERWRRLAKTAAQQSGRVKIPRVALPEDFPALLDRFALFDRVLFAWELTEGEPLLRDRLPQLLAGAGSRMVGIGPEGGFSSEESARAAAAGAQLISLGSRILRTETAGLVLLALLNYLA